MEFVGRVIQGVFVLMLSLSTSMYAIDATCYATSDDKQEIYTLKVDSSANPLHTATTLDIQSGGQIFNTEGVAYRPSDGKMYMINKSDSGLYAIDLTTGAIHLETTLPINKSSGMEFYNGVLYVTRDDVAPSQLYAFDTTTWASLAGYPKTLSESISGLAINSNGDAYAMDDYFSNPLPVLWQLDLATGTLSNSVVLQTKIDAEGLSFANDDKLYTEDELYNPNKNRQLYEIDTLTGAVMVAGIIDNNGTKFNDIEAVACNVGEATNIIIPPVIPTIPTVSIGDAELVEGNSSTQTLRFTVELNQTTTSDVTVDYALVDGTALQGEDYVDASDTVTILAGSSSTTIDVVINGDTTIEATESFNVVLSNPTNATILDGTAIGLIINDDISIGTSTAPTVMNDEINCIHGSATLVTIPVLNNDSDIENDMNISSVTITSQGAIENGKRLVVENGEWSVDVTGNILFTPTANCTQAPDPITYVVSDKDGNVSPEATVTITLSTPVVPPVVIVMPETNDKNNRSIVNTSGATDIVDLSGINAELYILKTLPTEAMGVLSLADGTVVSVGDILTQEEANGLKFTPNPEFVGTVIFTYAAIDSKGIEDTTPATVRIPVIASVVDANTTSNGCASCDYTEDSASLNGVGVIIMMFLSTLLGLFLTRKELEATI